MEQPEVNNLSQSLKKLEPGFLPYPVFKEIARLMVITTIEVVPFFKGKVLLLKRPEDDEFWPGEWHIPGSILRATDTKDSFSDPFRRIEEELDGEFRTEPVHLRTIFRQEKRGAALAIQFIGELKSNKTLGVFYDTNKLPDKMVKEHLTLLNIAFKKIK